MKNLISSIWFDLKDYTFESFKSDLNAGIVTGIIAIPLSLALAIATGVPPIFGLYTAAIAGITASIFAGSRFNVSGPAAAMVPILAGIIAKYGVETLPLIGVIAGIFLVLFGVFKLGTFIKYVPLSVTLGFTAGIAIVLFFGQLNSFLGLTGIHPHEHFHEKVWETFTHLGTINITTVLIGTLSLALLLTIPNIKRISKVPPSLVAVIFCTSIVYFGSRFIPAFDSVKTISDSYGTISLGFPPIKVIDFKNIPELIVPALQVAFLIAVESLLCAVVADKMAKTRHHSNQELIAQGISNIITPMFSGIPSTAVIARTGTSIKNGAKSRIAALIHALLVLLFLMMLAPAGSLIPLTVLSTILFVTAWKISEQKEIRTLISKAPKSDILILFLTMGLTVFLDLTVAVGVGMFFSVLLIFKKLSTVYGEEITDETEFVTDDLKSFLKKHKHVQFLNFEGNFSMGAAGSIKHNYHINEDSKKVIIRMKEVHHVDLSGLEALESFINTLKEKGKKVYLTSINKRISLAISRFNLEHHVDGVYESSSALIKDFK